MPYIKEAVGIPNSKIKADSMAKRLVFIELKKNKTPSRA